MEILTKAILRFVHSVVRHIAGEKIRECLNVKTSQAILKDIEVGLFNSTCSIDCFDAIDRKVRVLPCAQERALTVRYAG